MNAKLKMIVSMLIFGTISIFVKYIPLPSSGIAFYRAAIALVGLCIYKLVRRESLVKGLDTRTFLLLLLSGGAMGFNWVLLFEAYNYTTVATATLCYYFAPVLLLILSPILFKEKLTLKQTVCFIMSTIGLVLITAVGKEQGGDYRGILLGLGAAFLYATVMIINKYIKGIDGITRTVWQFICAAVVVLPYTIATNGLSLAKIGITGGICLAVLGLVYTCFTYVLYFTSVAELEGRVTALFGYIDPLTAVLVSVVVFGERLLPLHALGGIMILGFTLLSELKKSQSK